MVKKSEADLESDDSKENKDLAAEDQETATDAADDETLDADQPIEADTPEAVTEDIDEVVTEETEATTEDGETDTPSEDAPMDPEDPEELSEDVDEVVADDVDEVAADELENAEAVADTYDDPAPVETVQPSEAPREKIIEHVVEKRGGFFTAFLGGVVAALLGFIVGRGDMLDAIFPGQGDAEITQSVAANSAALSEIRTSLDALAATAGQTDLGPLQTQVDELASTVASVGNLANSFAEATAQLTALQAQVTEIEKRPLAEGVSEEAIAAYETELARLQETVSAQRAEFEKLLSDAQALEAGAAEAAQIAAAGAAMARLRSNIDNGTPYSGPLSEIETAGFEIPGDLPPSASSGVSTIASLRESFPDAAREALAADRAEQGDTAGGVGNFLQRQLGARSVTPREGTDADAVLSRAEDALTHADLASALTELSGLSDVAKSAMQNWITQAETREAVSNAADALASQMNTN